MKPEVVESYVTTLREIESAGLWKHERIITSAQGPEITVNGKQVLNFCANNYLGLSSHPRVIEAAHRALDAHGYGMSSVRFICGTQDIHKQLEQRLARFVGMEDSILYGSCFDANGGLFETLLDENDAIISASLNHASIIDGVRLCKAKRFRYVHDDMNELETRLKEAADCKRKMIATDGVFSMDGDIAPLDKVCDLAEQHGAILMVDDSHATGFLGKTGRGSHEYRNVMGRIDIITSTLGKALGGASGGFIATRKPLIDLLRNRSRPYLFSNTLAPAIVGGTLAVLDLLEESTDLRDKLMRNAKQFRTAMTAAGFNIRAGEHPIVPIMLGEAKLAHDLASQLLDEGIYVIGFSFPVVPQGKARIRVQLSAAHSEEQVERATKAFAKVGKTLRII